MKNIKIPTIATIAKDQTIEDMVRESPVDQYGVKAQKRLGIAALVVVLLLLFLYLTCAHF